MSRLLTIFLCLAGFSLLAATASYAQDAEPEPSGGSAEVEESDEQYRRRMELEDARQRNLGYTLPPESYVAQQDKLDKLPEASRDNIRDQLVDIIVENGEWEPSDALKEYPYEPTAAALGDPALLEQEQAAWDEQISTAGARQSALDFLRAQQGQQASPTTPAVAPGTPAAEPESLERAAGNALAESAPMQAEAPDSPATGETGEPPEIDLATPGIIPIEDLDKLEGAGDADGTEGA